MSTNGNTLIKFGSTDKNNVIRLKIVTNNWFIQHGKQKPLDETNTNFGASTQAALKTAFGTTELTIDEIDYLWKTYGNNQGGNGFNDVGYNELEEVVVTTKKNSTPVIAAQQNPFVIGGIMAIVLLLIFLLLKK